jgi:hypothetical protein
VGLEKDALQVFLPSFLVQVEYLFPSECRCEFMPLLNFKRRNEKVTKISEMLSENTLLGGALRILT